MLLSLFWLLSANRPFLSAALKGREWADPGAWGFALALGVMVLALHFLLVALVGVRHAFKPLATVLILGTAFASHFMDRFGVYLDPSMLRNVLRTDAEEAAHARPPVPHGAGPGGRAYRSAREDLGPECRVHQAMTSRKVRPLQTAPHGRRDALLVALSLLAWICWTACAVLNALFRRPQAAPVPAAWNR